MTIKYDFHTKNQNHNDLAGKSCTKAMRGNKYQLNHLIVNIVTTICVILVKVAGVPHIPASNHHAIENVNYQLK